MAGNKASRNRKTFLSRPGKQQPSAASPLRPAAEAQPAAETGFNRREFLQMAGAGALITTAGYLGFKVLTGKAAAVDEASGGTTTASEDLPAVTAIPLTGQQSRTACPKGLVNDPYPGRCHHYVDRDGDGYCDLSVA